MTYSVYILKCCDNTLYTGIAKDVQKRLDEHNSSKLAAKYTRGRRPLELVYQQEFATRSEALKSEFAIKKLTRAQKLRLIHSQEEC